MAVIVPDLSCGYDCTNCKICLNAMSTDELHTNLIPIGTQIVTRVPVFNRSGKIAHPAGAVGVVVAWLDDGRYRVRFLDGYEENLSEVDLAVRKQFQVEGMKDAAASQRPLDKTTFTCPLARWLLQFPQVPLSSQEFPCPSNNALTLNPPL